MPMRCRFLIVASRRTGLALLIGAMLTATVVVPIRGTRLGAGLAAIAVWDFEADEPGKIAKGFSAEVGTWVVAKDGGNQVLFQTAKNEDAVFNLALVRSIAYQDVDLTVRLKAIAGEVDRGGGLVWRAKDKHNYYICRYNPLEDNFRVYKVENGKRTQFASAKVPGDEAWHALRATMSGNKIACYLDDKKLLEVEDSTFPGPGMIGLWSKADAQSYFDDLSISK
ncbi:MAG: hypothetical protein P4L84_31150 [Isosphaeraceae bacterium]|nr:hypothetical protein [Isosphaeraceae bacterium]